MSLGGTLLEQGSFPFRARDLIQGILERTAYLHQPWHDIEFLVYSIVFILFINPTGPDGPTGMSKEEKSRGLVHTLAPFAGFFKKAPELVGTVAKYCGLGLKHSWIYRVDEGVIFGPKWTTGELSHDGLIGD
ncbi:BZ3500_MvSof-1268-A1-R1_Chr5-3g08196 [Microbotryum saponariae]|uniref:BZ3500_MvSof-1268-A1-R1_Chr5-3g08196 protein n=1 Tax=Microbotryum saponariae TaxID=289078 RepID=A0A2X0MF75_9BASI|nr:BZ3500_MvSof-1268-A1-R1_Chr5-3g08196 [Microbotryum saponariae]SDA07955.1 BZ3501_MvSof-1269-A2-R1_Chr5-1g07340 [Microbotryum saponariae]